MSTAKSFMTQLDQFGKSFNTLWAQLQQFGGAAKQVLQAIVNDPIGFIKNLAAGVGQGVTDFINNLGQSLQTGFMKWLLGSGLQDLQNLTLPNFSSPDDIARFFLDFFKISWSSLQTTLVNTLGAANIAVVT